MKSKENREYNSQDNVPIRSGRGWQIYLQVGFIGALVAVTLWYALSTSTRIVRQYAPLVDAAMEIKLEASTAHLWFEEFISGDTTRDISIIWEHLDQSEWYAQAMLEGGQNNESTYIPLDDPELREDILEVLEEIKSFRVIAEERLAHPAKSFIGSDIDQRFDDVFESFLKKADNVETTLQQIITRDIKRFRSVQFALIVLCFVLTGIVAAVLHRFVKIRAINMVMLNTTNQQLRASEQQLKAANHQLRAHEQQLTAANQQLRASEQQLRATNQQLRAGEQQQTAANHELGERVKELQCMYGVTESIKKRNTLEEVFQDVADLIPPGWHYPEITRGKVIFDGKECVSEPFEKTKWKQSSDIIINGQSRGSIEVYYLKKCPELDEGPFMTEERNLINGMARNISEAIERKNAEEAIRANEQQLTAANQQLRASEQQLTAANQQLRASEQQLRATNQQLRAGEQQLQAANQQLTASETLLLEAQQIAGLGFYSLDLATGIWTSSGILDKIFGIDKDFKRDTEAWLQIVHPDQRDEMGKDFSENVVGKREPFNREYRIIRQDDQAVRWVHGLGRLELDDNGEPIRMTGTIQDITERKLAEQNMRDMARIVERSLNEIYIFDAETFKFIQVNKGACNNIGYSKEELAKLTPLDIKPEHTKESFNQLIKPLRNGDEEIITFETVHMRKNGSPYDVEVHLQLSDFFGKPVFVAIILDITETKRLQALQSRAERLETAGEIAGQVAHDFNNLLGPMIAYPEFLRNELPKDHSSIQMLNDIEKAATTMADINQQLLTLSRRGHFEQETLDLNSVVTQSLNQTDTYPDTLQIEMDMGKNLMNIKGGPAQLSRIITNLVNNALDAMQGAGHLFIKTENYYADDVSGKYGRIPKGEYVKLTINDSGCGITNEALPKIFDPFFTTKKTDKQRGSGLGLSVVHAVMEDHNGYIDLQSEFGQGTSFYLYFPITRDELESSETAEIIGGTESILVIDDDTLQREVALNLLNKLGYNATAVDSGKMAVEFLRDNPQDLLVLDMVMPGGIDGAETYRLALEINSSQKAIIVSGFAETERVSLAIKLGAGGFIRKPLTLKIISAAVRKELDKVLA